MMKEKIEWKNWMLNEKKNNRRCYLIDKDIDGKITSFEKVELAHLQRELLLVRQETVPLPLKE